MNTKSIATINHEELGTLTIRQGIEDDVVPQLMDYTRTDPAIALYTSDTQRFKNTEAYTAWRMKGRTIYTLQGVKNMLLGIIWFGDRPLPNAEYDPTFNKELFGITFSIRIYGHARGKKIGYLFAKEALEDFRHRKAYISVDKKGMWLAVVDTNIPAIKLYQRLGFQQVASVDENHKIVMALFEK